jgi:hypothetical protein
VPANTTSANIKTAIASFGACTAAFTYTRKQKCKNNTGPPLARVCMLGGINLVKHDEFRYFYEKSVLISKTVGHQKAPPGQQLILRIGGGAGSSSRCVTQVSVRSDTAASRSVCQSRTWFLFRRHYRHRCCHRDFPQRCVHKVSLSPILAYSRPLLPWPF